VFKKVATGKDEERTWVSASCKQTNIKRGNSRITSFSKKEKITKRKKRKEFPFFCSIFFSPDRFN